MLETKSLAIAKCCLLWIAISMVTNESCEAQSTPTAARPATTISQGSEPAVALVSRFDKDGNHRLNYTERSAARKFLAEQPVRPQRSRGSRLFQPSSPGPKVSPSDVVPVPETVSLYESGTVRTLFLNFDHPDWEQELSGFWHTDVLVDGSLEVDGKSYADVGVSFRGNNSFTAVPEGSKRSLSIKVDYVNDQELLGYRELKLLNANQDPTFLRTILYLQVARDYLPALKANFVQVVINGESWGVYVNQQAFGSEFMRDEFATTKGVRWKSPNNSDGGGFSYLGEDIDLYRRWYEMKGADDPKAWGSLIRVCKVLNETPPSELEAALEPIFDVDGALRFLALDMALVNNDGYWNDGSDFNIYLDDESGRIHLTPHDANEGFRTGGRSGLAGPDPLSVLDDPDKALRSKLLAAPALRKKYLCFVGEIAEKWLDWERLGPLVDSQQKLIVELVNRDTRKHESTEAFTIGVYGDGKTEPPPTSIKGFAEQRRAYLLNHSEISRSQR